MTDNSFLQAQAGELARLLAESGDDPILAPQLRERLADTRAELDRLNAERGSLLPPPRSLPRAAFFLVGGPDVSGSDGVQPRLAGQALVQYEGMFVEQAIHDERQAARAEGRQRRQRNAPAPALLLTGTPRGSFGFEFVPKVPTDGVNGDLHAQSLKRIADWIEGVVGGNLDELANVFGRVPAGVRPSLRGFLRVLAEHGTGLRLAFSDAPARRLSGDQVKAAAERLQRDVNLEDDVKITGILTGVRPQSADFDFLPNDGQAFSGEITDDAGEDDIEQIWNMQRKPCIARFQRTTVTLVGKPATSSYVLLGVPTPIAPAGEGPPSSAAGASIVTSRIE